MSEQAFGQGDTPPRLVDVIQSVSHAREERGELGHPLSIYVMPALTANGLEAFVEYHSMLGGVDATVAMGRYNILHQDLINPASPLHEAKPDLLILPLAWEIIAPDLSVPADETVARLEELFLLAAERAKCPVVVNTFMAMGAPSDRRNAEQERSGRIAAVNDWIRDFVADHQAAFFLCDWTRYLQEIGIAEALDDRYWFMAKAPFKPAFLNRYAEDIAKIGRAVLGLNKKVLVLDCDNTLWGGVLGEEGVDGIALDNDAYPGNVFFAVQQTVLNLVNRGVILAICSKNNEADVMEVLSTHPHCLLKPDHFAAMKVNWDNKVENIRQLANELNVGLDSLVFVDDSPFEIELVNAQLPQVTVVQVPAKIYQYPRTLTHTLDRYFYAAASTDEDAKRTELYKARDQANAAKAAFSDTEAYLRSLDITLDVHRVRESEVPRVAQLTGKTNQFNVCKRVYSEAEIREAMTSEDRAVFVGVTADKFGKLGLTIVCIVEKTGDTRAHVDSFLMSCRVFERNLEYSFFDQLIGELQNQWDLKEISAVWVQTEKNQVCRDFFATAGMDLIEETDGTRRFQLDLAERSERNLDYIRII